MPDSPVVQILLVTVAAPLALALVAFWIWMLVACLKNKKFTSQDRLIWVVVIVALKILGALIYYFMEHRARPRADTTPATGG